MTCLATTPPNSGSYFTDAVYENATLYVPMRSLELYMNAEGWSNFQHIEGIDTGDDPGLTGDVNGDGKVAITDVTALIDQLLGDGSIDNPAADVNGDGKIAITDVTELIDLLLGGN